MGQKDPIPGYELLEVLGEGGMATVFKARQRSTGRLCALKILRDFEAPEERREVRLERFVREGTLLERLDHPNVVRLLANGRDERGGAWLALEYVDGPSLEELLERRGTLPIDAVLAVMTEVGRVLEHLAGRRVVHRDVKPSNIVITAGGGLKVCDFGIACSLGDSELGQDDAGPIQQDLPIGTIDYMAPEQVEDEEIDHRVDLFALGSTAYRCLAGMTPFTGETIFARLRELVERDPPPLPREIPKELAALVLSLLSKNPVGRPSAPEVVKTAERLAAQRGHKGEGWMRRVLTDALAQPRKPKPKVEEPLLAVLSSVDLTIERPLRPGEGFVIGRSLQDGGASTSIGRPWISRQHCRIELGERGLVVTDLGSANGTWVNHLKVGAQQSALLRAGDKLTLGKTILTVSLENAPASLVQPAWKCLLCQAELPKDAGSTDEATQVEERHLCARCRARIEEDRTGAEKRARSAIQALGGRITRRLELGGPILRFELEKSDGGKLAAHALDLGPSAATLYVERSQAATALDHPGLLKIRSVREAEGVLVVVTDAVLGRPATEVVLREGVLSWDDARRAAATLARAVAHAKWHGVTAIAVRPGLVLLGARGQAQLMDVGLAPALVEAGRSRVELGRSVPVYDAPEAQGIRETSPRALAYSVAAVTFFLLTGEAPAELRSNSRRVVAASLQSRSGIAAPLARIVDAALDENPSKRPAGPDELAAALEGLAPTKDATPAVASKRPGRRVPEKTQEVPLASSLLRELEGTEDATTDPNVIEQREADKDDTDDTSGQTMVLHRPPKPPAPATKILPSLPPVPPPLGKIVPGKPTPPPAPGRVDLPGRLERLANERASGVLSIHGARARGRIELGAGKIIRVAAPHAVALEALATLLAAREAATTFEPGAHLDPQAARVDLTVQEALARARGERS